MTSMACARSMLVCLAACFAVVGCGDDDGDVAILHCDGNCNCDDDTRTCSCAGGTECALDGEGDVTFTCDGNASCDLSCGDGCDIVCPGTTGCVAESGASASFTCQGNATCEFTCLSDCSVSCGGATQCLVHCDDEDECDLSDCRGAIDCGEGTFACGRACP